VFTFGDAGFFGQPSSQFLGRPVGIRATPDGRGYWVAENNGIIQPFGDAGTRRCHRAFGPAVPRPSRRRACGSARR
jgi:hypothetical protein